MKCEDCSQHHLYTLASLIVCFFFFVEFCISIPGCFTSLAHFFAHLLFYPLRLMYSPGSRPLQTATFFETHNYSGILNESSFQGLQ